MSVTSISRFPASRALWLNLACAIILALLPRAAKAQTGQQLTQYWAMPTLYNPAETGSTDYLRIRGYGRMQWLGITNAPKGFGLAADIPFRLLGKRLGAGITFEQEKLGLFSNLLVCGQLSYNFKLFGGFLGVGLQAGYYNSNFKGTETFVPDNDDYHNGSDTSIPNKDITGSALDLSAGLNFTHRYFWVAASALHFTSPKINLVPEGSASSDTQEYETELPRMLYFMAGSNIQLPNSLFLLQPSVMVKTNLSTVVPELTLRTTYNNFITFGAGYRWKDAVSVMVGAEFKNFFVGYAYDYPVSAIAKASSGSHEIVAGYRLKLDFSGKNRNRHRSIRIM